MTVYPQRRTPEKDDMSEGVFAMSMSYHDVEKLQALYPDNQIELKEGKIIIMSPSDGISGVIGRQFGSLLGAWVYNHALGQVFDASTGFRFPNGDLLSPDVSFVSRNRLKQVPRAYLSVVPELIVEIKSSRDRVRELEEKIVLFLSQGVQVGILIDPDTHTVSVFRSDGPDKHADTGVPISQVTTLRDGDLLTIPDLFPGWEISVTSIWPPTYE
ncbi:MAG TPA: Uma2 family endonuclease [Ktedonobacteraceae bacterium]|nr:Uma2 family endonuclease [Ktedonobacteraceae bacterium]